MEKKTRKVSTVFKNKSGSTVMFGALKLTGERDGFKFSLSSAVSNNGKVVKLTFNLTELYARMSKYNLTEKLENKINKKFEAYIDSMEQNNSEDQFTVIFVFNDVEIISTPKEAIKYLKKISKFTKTLNSIVDYCDKLIEKKELKIQELARKKAEKAAIKKEAAEAIVESESVDPETLM